MTHLTNFSKLSLALIIYTVQSLFRIKNDDIWLIGERKHEAKDNGYHLFKYIRTSHPSKRIFYIIDKASSQKNKVDKYNNVINHNSLQHYIYFLKAKKLILPFERSTFPDLNLIWYAYRIKLFKKKVAFIQHGVTKEKQVHYSYNNRFKFDLFVCCADEECKFVKSDMDYPEYVAKKLGFARHDNLNIREGNLNQIFFMPTWRSWMAEYSESEFLTSRYYMAINNFLNNEELHAKLIDKDIKVILYLHDIFQEKFSHLFVINCPNIIVASNKLYDVQKLMKQSAMLITDFSSVAFDFAYMEKPLVYFQFDQKEYYSKHFIKGYFDYHDHGFGLVCQDTESLKNKISELVDSSFIDDRKYIQRSIDFFGVKDKYNCERNYKAINEL